MALTGVLLTLVGCKKDETEPTDSASIPKISVSEPKVYTSEAATYTPVSYTHLTLPTSDLV